MHAVVAAVTIGKGNVLQNNEILIFGFGNKTASYSNGIFKLFASVSAIFIEWASGLSHQ
jgi:hypothetical protein